MPLVESLIETLDKGLGTKGPQLWSLIALIEALDKGLCTKGPFDKRLSTTDFCSNLLSKAFCLYAIIVLAPHKKNGGLKAAGAGGAIILCFLTQP